MLSVVAYSKAHRTLIIATRDAVKDLETGRAIQWMCYSCLRPPQRLLLLLLKVARLLQFAHSLIQSREEVESGSLVQVMKELEHEEAELWLGNTVNLQWDLAVEVGQFTTEQ